MSEPTTTPDQQAVLDEANNLHTAAVNTIIMLVHGMTLGFTEEQIIDGLGGAFIQTAVTMYGYDNAEKILDHWKINLLKSKEMFRASREAEGATRQ